MLEQLLPVVEDWEPSVLVCDKTELAGPIAAAAAGVPNVTHGFGHPLPQAVVDRVAEAMVPTWWARGLEPRPHAGIYEHLYLDIYPQSLNATDVPAGTRVQALRPAPVVTAVPEPDVPLVYVTFGTVWSRDLIAHRTVLEGIRDLPIKVLVTLGLRTYPAGLGDRPSNIEIAEYVPQDHILPRAAAVVSHAGSGTFLAALAAGVPQVVLPIAADQYRNAAAGAASGAAIRVDPDAFSATAVREALMRLLDDPDYAAAAARAQDEIRAMPGHNDVVAELERCFGPDNGATSGRHFARRSPASPHPGRRKPPVAD